MSLGQSLDGYPVMDVDELMALSTPERIAVLLDAAMRAGLDDVVWGEE